MKKILNLQSETYKQNISILGIFISALTLLPLAISRIIYPFDQGKYESHIWASALLTVNGDNPYKYALESPYVVSAYGYVYYLIVGVEYI